MLVPAWAAEKEKTALGKQMEAMNDAFKAIKKETDPVKGASEARDAQAAALKSATETPALIKEMPEGPEKAKALAEYHKMVGKVYVTLCEVEEAFMNGKIDQVATILGTLKDMKKEGHKKFVKEEDQ